MRRCCLTPFESYSRLGLVFATLLALVVVPSHQQSEMCRIDPTEATFILHADPPSLRNKFDSSATTYQVGPFELSAHHQEESKIVADLSAALASYFVDACSQQYRQFTERLAADGAVQHSTAITRENESWLRAGGGCEADLMAQVAVWTRAHCSSPAPSPNEAMATCEPRLPDETVPIIMEPITPTAATPATSSNSQNSTAKSFEGSLAEHVLHRFILPQRLRSAWNVYYDDMVTYARGLGGGAPLRIVEVGTMYGGLANRLAEELQHATIFAVDPHLGGYDEFDLSSNELQEWALRTSMEGQIALDKQGGDDTTQRTSTVGSDAAQANASLAFSKAWATALASEQVARHGCRYHHLQMPSADAATLFQRESLDMVFVDGLHTYSGVATDILAWAPKLKRPGGAMVFNDVGFAAFPGVSRAVAEWVNTHRLQWAMGHRGVPPGQGNLAVVFRD